LLDEKVDPFNVHPIDSFETLSVRLAIYSKISVARSVPVLVNVIGQEWQGIESYDRLLIQISRFGGPDLYHNVRGSPSSGWSGNYPQLDLLQCLPEPLLRFDDAL